MEVSAAVWDVHIPSEFKGLVNYAASKIQSEMKAWNWVKENKPNFVLNSILPNMNVRSPKTAHEGATRDL